MSRRLPSINRDLLWWGSRRRCRGYTAADHLGAATNQLFLFTEDMATVFLDATNTTAVLRSRITPVGRPNSGLHPRRGTACRSYAPWPAGTRSLSMGGPGGVPSPNGLPPSASSPHTVGKHWAADLSATAHRPGRRLTARRCPPATGRPDRAQHVGRAREIDSDSSI